MKNFLKKGIIPIGAYCSPMPPNDYYGKPNRITEEQYRIAKDCGIDIVYGHNDCMNTPNEKYAFLALDCAEKVGITYYVKDAIANEYTALGEKEGVKAYLDLSDEEKADLDKRFEASLLRYCNHKAFGGISFCDEPGSDSFAGIAAAKRVFDRVCPDKSFYVNMYPYYIAATQYQYGYWCRLNKPSTVPEYEVKEGGRNIDRYKYLYENFVNTVKPDFFSYDAYPFVDFDDAKTAVHEILWEMPQYLHGMETKNGIPFWTFLQAGGLWEGKGNVRVPTEAEVRIGISVPLLYGTKGLQVFPYMYPNDWLNDKVAVAGIVDADGNKTKLFDYYKAAFRQVKAIDEYLIKADIKGIIKVGKYENGLPDEKRLSEIKWNECIFKGELPKEQNIEITSFGNIKDVSATSQVLIGCNLIDGKEAYFAVNNSITADVSLKIRFKGERRFNIIQAGESTSTFSDEINVYLKAGENVLMQEK